MIEELDDVIHDIANKIGVYGVHQEDAGDEFNPRPCKCRACFESDLEDRIRNAMRVEESLGYRHRRVHVRSRKNPRSSSLTSQMKMQEAITEYFKVMTEREKGLGVFVQATPPPPAPPQVDAEFVGPVDNDDDYVPF